MGARWGLYIRYSTLSDPVSNSELFLGTLLKFAKTWKSSVFAFSTWYPSIQDCGDPGEKLLEDKEAGKCPCIRHTATKEAFFFIVFTVEQGCAEKTQCYKTGISTLKANMTALLNPWYSGLTLRLRLEYGNQTAQVWYWGQETQKTFSLILGGILWWQGSYFPVFTDVCEHSPTS